MGIDTQLNKGVLEGCVLWLLQKQPLFSGEIVERMRKCGFSDFSEGTLYPMLLRLEREGCFLITRVPNSCGPPKKYYTLSGKGKKRLELFIGQWQELMRCIGNLFSGEDSNA